MARKPQTWEEWGGGNIYKEMVPCLGCWMRREKKEKEEAILKGINEALAKMGKGEGSNPCWTRRVQRKVLILTLE